MNLTDITAKITAYASGQPNTAEALREILNDIAGGFAQTEDIREIEVSNAYLSANFDGSGLGNNERIGWAICNGNNGTRDRRGMVPMQYSPTYPTLGAPIGNATVTLGKANIPQMDLRIQTSDADNGGGTRDSLIATDAGNKTATTYTNTVNNASANTPVSLIQPSLITLFIMKL